MLKVFTSLSFLYAICIVILLCYALIFYRDFQRAKLYRRRFPIVFALISLACLGFLYINFHAPFALKTFSNLDHQFISLNGYLSNKKIELGTADTANDPAANFNRFVLSRKGELLQVESNHSEEPFYVKGEKGWQLASYTEPAIGHTISLQCGQLKIAISSEANDAFQLAVGDSVFQTETKIKRGISVWNLFREHEGFIYSAYYNNQELQSILKSILLLRNDAQRSEGGELRYFVSGKIFSCVNQARIDGKLINESKLNFQRLLQNNSEISWGVGFLEKNSNQFQLKLLGADSFRVDYKFPVSYPLTEEQTGQWYKHRISKFLVADPAAIQEMPLALKEGFSFFNFRGVDGYNFKPILLTYDKDADNKELNLKVKSLAEPHQEIKTANNQFKLKSANGNFLWDFNVRDSFEWQFAGMSLNLSTWQWLIFGSLAIYCLLILIPSTFKKLSNQDWVWQLLSSVFLLLLTTRFFLYWRYKSFPPFEGMDLPSSQQLNSFGNFGVILGATIGLALILSLSPFFPSLSINKLLRSSSFSSFNRFRNIFRSKVGFFLAWAGVLGISFVTAWIFGFDPGVCRHLAIVLVLVYFVFLYLSYQHSPLMATGGNSWWQIDTNSRISLLVSNPVKIVLSLSLTALFVFVDIGFAIVFLNFLLFNEAFLSVNYAVAGLSSGSRSNASRFAFSAVLYSVLFILNLLFAPYVFQFLLASPIYVYLFAYLLVAIAISYVLLRILPEFNSGKKKLVGLAIAAGVFVVAIVFIPKQRILDKAAMTRYRIDVLTEPVDKAIMSAYSEGKTYEPVIRAAQNQWFINTFIDDDNNPEVNKIGFNLLAHAPQNKGAKYNAQATDLVASRFLVAEHGKWSVLLLLFILLLPPVLMSSFYKLYPDFTTRVNDQYASFTTGFSMLNYLLITGLLVILAATGRYIFFGQDLPFGSILSKQSILFPAILLLTVVLIFRNAPLERYARRSKMVPAFLVLLLLGAMLFFARPAYNTKKEFAVANLSTELDQFLQLNLQPLADEIDTASGTSRLSFAKKDELFTDSLRKVLDAGLLTDVNPFFLSELKAYAKTSYSRHIDDRNMIFLDLHSGSPKLAVNENFFRVVPPPHLQEMWKGNVYSDSSNVSVATFNPYNGSQVEYNFQDDTSATAKIGHGLSLIEVKGQRNDCISYSLSNDGSSALEIHESGLVRTIKPGSKISLTIPTHAELIFPGESGSTILTIEPKAFMRNFYVNGSRYYAYPMADRFSWARNFAEGVSTEYVSRGQMTKNAFVSLNYELMDSVSMRISDMMNADTAYHSLAEYGICIADGSGRLIAMNDYIKDFDRPDPNDKLAYNHAIIGENGYVSQSLLRKRVGNLNLLRMNPGPGSTLKPIVFTAIASQLSIDWNQFAAEGFTEKLDHYGGQKVPEFDFEKNNGTIRNVVDYIKYSDNYYHSNVLLLGSYPKQSMTDVLSANFISQNPEEKLHWPWFSYQGKNYWMDGFKHWPGYENGKADFGSDSSFTSIGLWENYGIPVNSNTKVAADFSTSYDSSLFNDAGKNQGYILPEPPLFDQHGSQINHGNAYDLFINCFRGHVKGSSQVMIPPVKMTEAFGKLVTQNKNYKITLNPSTTGELFTAFNVDPAIAYNDYLNMMREQVFAGMQAAIYSGTAAVLGTMLKQGEPYYYYGKTGTTGDDERKTKSKLFVVIISKTDLTSPENNFRNNKFYTIYFTSQNGPAKQNEAFQAAVIRFVENSKVFQKYMR